MKQTKLFLLTLMVFSSLGTLAQGSVAEWKGDVYYNGIYYQCWIHYDTEEDFENGSNGHRTAMAYDSPTIDYDSYDGNIPSGHLTILSSVTIEGEIYPVEAISIIYEHKLLTSVTIPNSVKTIDNGGFYSCENLKYVFFEEGCLLESLSAGNHNPGPAFWRCGIVSIELPASLKAMGDEAFGFCNSLEEMVFPASLSEDFQLESRAIIGCNNLKDVYAYMLKPFAGERLNFVVGQLEDDGYSWKEYVPEDAVLHVQEEAFDLYRNTVPWSNFKNIVSDIFEEDDVAFQFIESNDVCVVSDHRATGNYVISSTISHKGKTYDVTAIGKGAYQGKTNLTSIEIPRSIAAIGEHAFAGCSNLKSVRCYSRVPVVLGKAMTRSTDSSSVFEGVDKDNCVLYVPEGCADAYRSAEGWGEFVNIQEFVDTGITSIITEGESNDVFNLQGRKVRAGVTSLDGLPKGVYIIRGKKVVVK